MTKDEALKTAITALEKAQNAMQTDMGVDVIDEAINACKEALEQPAQELSQEQLVCASKILQYLGYAQSVSFEPSADKRRDKVAEIITNFYTHPHQWQGLTDDEIEAIRIKTFDAVATNYETYRAIEQALKDKNDH